MKNMPASESVIAVLICWWWLFEDKIQLSQVCMTYLKLFTVTTQRLERFDVVQCFTVIMYTVLVHGHIFKSI